MRKVLTWLDENLELSIMMVLLSAIVIVMALQVFMRYVMQNSLSWPDEMTRYIFIWFVFLGISYGIRHQAHLKVDILEASMPKIKTGLIIVQDLFVLFFCIYMIQPSFNGIKMLVTTGQTSPALGISIYFVYLSLLIGLLLAIVRLIQKYVLYFSKRQSLN